MVLSLKNQNTYKFVYIFCKSIYYSNHHRSIMDALLITYNQWSGTHFGCSVYGLLMGLCSFTMFWPLYCTMEAIKICNTQQTSKRSKQKFSTAHLRNHLKPVIQITSKYSVCFPQKTLILCILLGVVKVPSCFTKHLHNVHIRNSH
jgi:hypothetical protein